jgi:hypothetical protein
MDVCKNDKSAIGDLIEMPLSRRSVSDKLQAIKEGPTCSPFPNIDEENTSVEFNFK